MMPTGTATLTLRSVVPISPNTSIVIWPWAQFGNLFSNTAAAPYVYAVGNPGFAGTYPSGAGLQGIANGARIISAGVRVCSVASATADSGVITIGCLPREMLSDPIIAGGTTQGGFPVAATIVATQGFNEFLNYLQTESYPLKCGASAFYRPQDPLDYTFRTIPVVTGPPAPLIAGTELTPFFVVGISGATALSSVLVEQILHLEYTVSDAITGVVNTGIGDITQQGLIDAAKALFGTLVDTTIEGVAGGIADAAFNVGGRVLKGILGPNRNRKNPGAASSYSSSDFNNY